MAFKQKSSGLPFKEIGSSPAKQEGPINEKQLGLQKSENPDTYVYQPGKKMKESKSASNKRFIRSERIGGLEDRASFIDEDANAEGRSTTKQEKKDKAKLQHEADIMRNRKPDKKKKSPAKQVKGNFNKTGSSEAGKKILTKQEKAAKHKGSFDKFQSQKQKGKEFVKGLKKVGKFLGGKTLGVAGMMMATSSKADQPKKGKGKTEYSGGKIDFTKKK